MQRLFSTFAGGWPGIGLLLLRLVAAGTLIRFGISGVLAQNPPSTVFLQIIGVGTGILLLVGLWTPVAGAMAAIVKVLIAFRCFSTHSGDPWFAIVQAALGATLAMVGPGAWSIDARVFGRKRIDLP